MPTSEDTTPEYCPLCAKAGLSAPHCKQGASDPMWLQREYHDSEQAQRRKTEEQFGKENVTHFSGGSAVRGQGVFLYGLIRRPALP